MEEGAPLSEPAAPVHAKELAHPRVTLRAHVILAGETVATYDGVGLVAHIAELAVSVLVKLTDGGHSDFLVYFLLKLSALSAANTHLTCSCMCLKSCRKERGRRECRRVSKRISELMGSFEEGGGI